MARRDPGDATRLARAGDPRPRLRLAWLLLALSLPWSAAAWAQEADLAITKSDGSSVYTPGATTTYTIVVSNEGGDDVAGATVSDPLPAGTSSASWTCATSAGAAACGAASGSGAIDATADLPAGGAVTYTFSLDVPSGYTGDLVNQASVDVPAGITDPNPANNTAIDSNGPVPTVQLAKLSQGGTGTYTYAMDNLSSASDSITTLSPGVATPSSLVSTVNDIAAAVAVTETPAPGFMLDGASCRDDNAGSTGNPASFGTLAGGALTIDPDNLRPGAQIVCTFTNLAGTDVSVSKTASPTAARTGEVVSYTLTVDNAGPGDASGTQLSDTPGAGLDCTAPGPTATCEASGGASCPGATVPVADLLGSGITLDALPVGGQVVVTLQCQVTAGP